MKKRMTLPGFRGFSARVGVMTKAEQRLGRYIKDGNGHPMGSPEDLAARIKSSFETKFAEHGVEIGGLKQQIDELIQRLAEGGGSSDRGASGPSLGEQFVRAKAGELTALHGVSQGRVSMHIKATITSATTDAAGSAGGLIVPQRDNLVMLPKRRLTIRQLLTVVNVTSNAVEYPKVKVSTNNAAPVAEGAAKPESDLQITMETAPIRTIAHWMKASRQVLDDAPQLRSMIDTELLYGLALVEEAQLLTGDGTGQNLEGMIPQATAYSAPLSLADLNMIDVIGLAILQASLTNVTPDGIVIHPSDWWQMRTTKDANGKYILGDPGVPVTPSLFGLPVVPTEAMTSRKFLVGSYASQTLYDRWEARVETGYVNDDFTKNLTTILGEERVGFAAKMPNALIYGDFDTALAS